MHTEALKVDWNQVKRCLAQIDKTSKKFLYQALLVGGAAVWFYRNRLKFVNDPDFKIGATDHASESQWLSRDVDFMGIFSQDAFLLLPSNVVESSEGKKHIEIEGVRLGFVQAGVAMNPEEAFEFARPTIIKYEEREVEFLVVDPLTLYFEKEKLCQRRGSSNDHLHARLLFEYVAYELVAGAEDILKQKASVPEAQAIMSFWIRVKNKAPEFLQDKRVLGRLMPLLANKSDHPIAQYLSAAQVV